MSHRPRLAMVGCGHAAERHLMRLVGDTRANWVSLHDPDEGAAKRLIDRFQLTGASVASEDEALTSPDIDAVWINSPTPLHFRQISTALVHGKHVLAEKPLATSPKEVRELIECARQADRLLGVAHQRRFEPVYRTARRELRENADFYGRIRSIHVFSCERWSQTIEGTWRNDPAVSGGYFADAGSHQIDACHFITGLAPTRVLAENEKRDRRVAIVTRAWAEMDNGASLTAHFVGDANHWHEYIQLSGERGDLILRDGKVIERWSENRESQLIILDTGSSPDRDFLDAILSWDDAANRPSFDSPAFAALVVSAWTQAVMESAATRDWVDVRTA